MIEYNGRRFRQTILFENMSSEKGRWMKTCSVLVDMVFTALSTARRVLRRKTDSPKEGATPFSLCLGMALSDCTSSGECGVC